MKKSMSFVVLCLVVALFLLAQTAPADKPGMAEGTKLGNIITSVIDVVFPPLSKILGLFFPPGSKDDDKITMSKKAFAARLKAESDKSLMEVKARLEPVANMEIEVATLREILLPCIEIQDYLREISVLVSPTSITPANWERVRKLWPLITERTDKFVNDAKYDVKAIRNRSVRDDLSRIINVGKGTKLERIQINYLDLSYEEMIKYDRPTQFRMEISNLLELYQTVQLVFTLSLQDFQADFRSTYDALAKTERVKYSGTEEASNPVQQGIAARLDAVLQKLPDKQK